MPLDRDQPHISSRLAEVLVAVDSEGNQWWAPPLPHLDVPSINAMSVATSCPLAAVAMRGGLVHVVDLTTGDVVAQAVEQGNRPEVAWIDRDGQQPLLLVAGGAAVQAFEIEPGQAE